MSDIADWIAAVGTAGATLLAAAAISIQQRDRRRAPANNIGGWIETKERDQGVRATLHILNTSNQPIYDVAVRAVGYKNCTRDYWVLGDLPPGEHSSKGQSEWGDHMDTIDFPRIEMFFRDASGHSWHRRADGSLRRVYRPMSAYHRYMKWALHTAWPTDDEPKEI